MARNKYGLRALTASIIMPPSFLNTSNAKTKEKFDSLTYLWSLSDKHLTQTIPMHLQTNAAVGFPTNKEVVN